MKNIKTGKKKVKSRMRGLRDELLAILENWITACFVLKGGLIKRDEIRKFSEKHCEERSR